ncbi:MAG: hypothetical protein DU429_01310 [Candidatus Tokpelaia sp.]|uniref:hypothetical protein n=1 Tax=Candidatus Tokpelaia sp. TaxID=2233777 RepID=UPI0012389844|nr:hypothetical protein [Candidatus Tokpelaia sp.]KAA6205852.1 MAG: hypothetical protein DU430_02940 [Candidatus Tokpelaia sp.]KAA6207702.1 MAG: hypothetical protein DU429_01310 [Candidatus Tokpelaia sp.]KAA6404876.1 hypothetical protein DPQ22_08245 [Candidatus Tokpelaia sp.]
MDSLGQPPKKVSSLSEEDRKLATPASNDEDSADKEAASINNEDLDRKAAQNEHKREQSFKNHFETLMIGALWIIGISSIAVFLIFILHMIFPICCAGAGCRKSNSKMCRCFCSAVLAERR